MTRARLNSQYLHFYILCKPNIIVYPAGFGRVFLFFGF
jgi:hypothetical protein